MLIRKKSLQFVALFLLLSSSIFAQTELKPGYVIDSQGTKINATFLLKDYKENATEIEAELNGVKYTLTPDDCKTIFIEGLVELRSATINIHLNPIADPGLPKEFIEDTSTLKTFIKVIAKGTYTLFQYNSTTRVYYFYQQDDGPITELVYRVRKTVSGTYEDNTYKELLLRLADKEGMANRATIKLEEATYSKGDLIPIFNILNRGETTVNRTRKNSTTKFFVFLGAQYNSTPSKFETYRIDSAFFNNSVGARAGITLEYAFPATKKHLSIGGSVWVSTLNTSNTFTSSTTTNLDPANNYTTSKKEVVTAKALNSHVDVFTNFVFNPKAKAQLALKLGMSVRFAPGANNKIMNSLETTVTGVVSSSNVNITNKDYDKELTKIIHPFTVPYGGLSLQYLRHGIELTYYAPGTIISNRQSRFPSGTPWSFKLGGIGIHYFYSVSKLLIDK